MGEDRLHLPKLAAKGVNWIMYHDRIQWSLKMRGLGDHLTSKAVTKSYTNAGDIGRVSPAQRCVRDKITASGLLDATIPDEVFRDIKSSETVMDVWAQLKALFEGKSRSVMVDLGRKFQTTRCGEDDDVHAHFNKLTHLREKLSALGRAVSDDEYVTVLIESLPSCYDSHSDSLTSSCDVNNMDITPTAVICAATCEYKKHVLWEENKAQDKAFAATTEADKKAKKKEVECFNCKKKGHYKSECWAKGGGKEGEGPKKPRDKDKSSKGKNKSKAKDGKDHANAAKAETSSSEDESWVVIVEVDDVPSQGESYSTQSALSVHAALTKARPKAEIYDSGASHHMSPFLHHFTNLHSIPPWAITAANSSTFTATSMGDLKINIPNGLSSTPITLKDVLYAPNISLTIVTVGKIADAGYSSFFNSKAKTCEIKHKSSKLVDKITKAANGLYRVDHPITAATAQVQDNILMVHRRLGHISADAIRTLTRTNAVTGLQLIDPQSTFTCDSCEHAKATCKVICKVSTTSPAQAFGDEVHSDVWGPAPVSSLGGHKYYVSFTDDYTRY